MRRSVVVGDHEIGGLIALERRDPGVARLPVDDRAQRPGAGVARHPVGRAVRRLGPGVRQWERSKRRRTAETGIDDEDAVRQRHGQEHVEPFGLVTLDDERHPRRVTRHAEAEFFQHMGEERRVLEAIPAAPGVDELGCDRVDVERNRPSEQHVEVLERDRLHMGADEAR